MEHRCPLKPVPANPRASVQRVCELMMWISVDLSYVRIEPLASSHTCAMVRTYYCCQRRFVTRVVSARLVREDNPTITSCKPFKQVSNTFHHIQQGYNYIIDKLRWLTVDGCHWRVDDLEFPHKIFGHFGISKGCLATHTTCEEQV